VSHEVAGFCPVKIRGGKGPDVAEKSVSEPLLYPPGGADEASPPEISQDADAKCCGKDKKGMGQQASGICLKSGQVVNCAFDDSRNKKLNHIHGYQTENSDDHQVEVFQKIGFDKSV